MKRLITLILLSFSLFSSEKTRESYKYITLGTGMIVFPNVGLGYRERSVEFGFDVSVDYSAFMFLHAIQGRLIGHYYYTSQGIKDTNYVGLGICGGAAFGSKWEGIVAPNVVFGKEYPQKKGCSKKFFEAHFVFYELSTMIRDNLFPFPIIYLKYGISF